MDKPSERVRVSILVDGIPEVRTIDAGETVGQVVSEVLLHDQQDKAGGYDLPLKGELPLDPASSLVDDGVRDGAVLAPTKDRGGGECGRQ